MTMTGRLGRMITVALLLLGASTSVAADVPSSVTGRVVRVGFCAERGIFDRMEDGSYTGLGPALIDRVAKRLNWRVEWQNVSHADGLERLARGDLDVMGGVLKTPERERTLNFVRTPMGVRRLSLYVLKSSPFERIDSSLNGCVIGAVEHGVRLEAISSILAAQGVKCSIRTYPDAVRAERALFTGEVGAVFLGQTFNLAEERELYTDKAYPTYIVTEKHESGLAEEIDVAMQDVLEEDPYLERRLRQQFFPRAVRSELSFTREERLWIERKARSGGTVTVDISPADPPYKKYDPVTGTFSGFMSELLTEISTMTGLHFEAVPPSSYETAATRFARGGTDIWLPMGTCEDPMKIKEGHVLDLLLPEAFCTRRYGGRGITDASSRIAVWSGDHRRLRTYAQLGYVPRLVICESREDCLRVVAEGHADGTFLTYGGVRQLSRKLGLSNRVEVRLVEVERYVPTFPFFLGPKVDPVFVSIMTKVLRGFSRDRMVDLVHRTEAHEMVASRLTPEQKLLWCGVPILSAALLLLLIMSVSRRRVAAALHRSEMSLRVADDALKDATKAREKMREALDRAEFAARSKTNFLATMSHEIRTPLNAVIGFSEFLCEPNLPSEKVGEYARGISFSANALLSLLNDILDISKFESGRTEGLDMRSGSCDVEALCREMESVFRMQGREKGLEVVFTTTSSIPRLKLAEPRMRQILLNLVGNAIKFTDRGRVATTASYQEGTFRIQVKDTGIGISPRGLKLVFDPFSQDMESRQGKAYAGTGLGLSIVKRLVEASGGTVTVESEIGKGSTFTVELPGIESLASKTSGRTEAKLADSATAFQHVLVVDDTKMNCRVLAAYCQKLGLKNVKTFNSGAETLAYLKAGGEADLVLSDLWMPGMNGSELAHEIARLRPALPVVAVTADTDARATFDINVFRAVLAKPVTTQKLRDLFATLV